ncbi:metal-dependent phosphohydrolase [Xenophilus sp. AP218F]|nr:metal-dependent phosphohydrolase [Xenophilus sp. AP218F]
MQTRKLMTEIVDPEAFQDFRDVMTDYAPKIESLVCHLGNPEQGPEILAQLFRALHSIKGDASMCQVRFFEPFIQQLETLLDRIRKREFAYQDVIGDVLLLVLDRLELALEALAHDEGIEDMQLPLLLQGLNELSGQPPEALFERCRQMVASMTGILVAPAVAEGQMVGRSADLAFFRSLALQFEQRLPQFSGRTARNLTLALETNHLAGLPIDAEQLEAAVYLHDLGMMLLPESFWLKAGRMSDEERRLMAAHPGWAAGLLQRMEGWQGAAQMVAQHHETPDGRGYPQGLRGEEICSGAKILALVDAFEAVTLKHAEQGARRSVLRAIGEINACERQFDRGWLAAFNQVMRGRLETRAQGG